MSEYKFWGKCHLVALALHNITGWDLIVLYGERKRYGETERVLIHAGVEGDMDFDFYDELGNQGDAEDCLNEYKSINEKYSKTEIKNYGDSVARFKNLCGKCEASYSEADLIYIENYLRDLDWVKKIINSNQPRTAS